MKKMIGFAEALDLTLSRMPLSASQTRPLSRSVGMILAEDVFAKVNSPSLDVSLKDGYAVVSADIARATAKEPVQLTLCGSINAGSPSDVAISSGKAMRVTTGAPIPDQSTAVVAEEFCRLDDDQLFCFNSAHMDRNILKKGTDINRGGIIAQKGEKLTPAMIGLLTSAGIAEAWVYKSPHIAVFGTGDEIVAPGEKLSAGKLYASNIAAICAWLVQFGFSYQMVLIPDNQNQLVENFRKHLPHVDAIITSGGIWGSEKDLMLKALTQFEWQGVYHRVRLGPGKAITFGFVEKIPVFSLPGGPPSNEMAFLQLALPGLLAMAGDCKTPFSIIEAEITQNVTGVVDWTQFIHAQINYENSRIYVKPYKPKSRLIGMAGKDALIKIPEGQMELKKGQKIQIQILSDVLKPVHKMKYK